MEAVFKSDFLKFFMASKFSRAANGRWNFSWTESVLILRIGQQEPLFFLGWKLLVEVVFENGAFWASKLLFEAHDYVTMAVKINNTHSRKQLNWKMAQNSREF